eukprot:CAMPEP_0176003346 /NCGR_PEP_ID=MMETSP0120_2-20121206/1126_1 /TAXON_ID=160619 /ORGANISM="Kryptoperidinium foliaceum, Strain CCMP 1326" /LENGTH=342 /DNA_ID=CAMNT_0017335985 /DNA_START=227 /DNA_END=1256 /DNA_ORIENTATION=-
MTNLLDFAVITIFAREVLEGGSSSVNIGQLSQWDENSDMSQREALRTVTLAAISAAAFAVVVCAAVAIPLAVLSKDFNDKTAIIIEGVSKVVAAVCILGLSLKMPKFFGLYYSKNKVLKARKGGSDLEEDDHSHGLTKKSIRFNVAWNIWREVAECGVFLIPFFLTGDGIKAIPLSAVVGCITGGVICVGIYMANQRMKSTVGLTIFTVGLLLILSTGLFSGGLHKFEMAYGYTPIVWQLNGDFWSVDRLPMTIFKPFGYSDTRTVLQMVSFWAWLFFSLFLHYRKYKLCRIPPRDESITKDDESEKEAVVHARSQVTPQTTSTMEGDSNDENPTSRGDESV